ncbi:MAG: hypothetical protein DRN27_05575 [Thermoplasmata archaeon]|nr:MAG: hypothetical protein DRN27_05575 [Thermoplasmata archaeon]
MKQVSVEKFIEKMGADVYPITIVKFLLNKRRIISYFSKAANDNFELRVKYTVDHSNCEVCKMKAKDGILCRQHTSIDRVLTARNVAYDLDTNTYLYKNEIFRMVGKRLVIVYCPHPKLITGDITDSKVRKITPITIEDSNLVALPEYDKLCDFISSDLLDQYIRCWFNNEFSLVTIPDDRNGQNWCLIPNK